MRMSNRRRSNLSIHPSTQQSRLHCAGNALHILCAGPVSLHAYGQSGFCTYIPALCYPEHRGAGAGRGLDNAGLDNLGQGTNKTQALARAQGHHRPLTYLDNKSGVRAPAAHVHWPKQAPKRCGVDNTFESQAACPKQAPKRRGLDMLYNTSEARAKLIIGI